MAEVSVAPLPRESGLKAILRRWGASIAIALILVPVVLIQPWKTYLDQGPIRSDGVGYFAWTRAVTDGRLSFCEYKWVALQNGFTVPPPTTAKPKTKTKAKAEACTNRYPPGLAILQFPVMAPLSARADPTNPVSPAQHDASLWLGGLALVMTCLIVTGTARRLGAEGWGVQFAVLAFVFGAGLFSYGTYLASFVHVHVAMFVALLVWCGVRVQQEGRSRRTTVVALLGGFFIVAMRNIDLFIVIVLVAFYLGWAWRAGTDNVRARARELVRDLLPLGIGIAGAVVLQLAINRYIFGHFQLSSYQGNTFNFDKPFQRQVLFSYTRGFFVYAPIALVTLMAGLTVTRTRAVTALYATLVATLTVIYGFWDDWALGGGAGYGHRGFIDAVPVGMLAAALVFTHAQRALRTTAVVLGVGATLWSLQLMILMLGYHYPEFKVDSKTFWSHTIGRDSLIGRMVR